MARVVRSGMWTGGTVRDFDIEGAALGTDATLILTDMAAGKGPRLHKHPYPEVWVVISGRALFTAGETVLEAATGDIVQVEADLPHKFVAMAGEPLRMVCIHHAKKFATIWLEPRGEASHAGRAP